MTLFNYVQSKFNKLEIKITASEGTIDITDYENKILETFKQLGIDLNLK